MKMKEGMSRSAAVKACYPQGSKAKSMTESIKDELNPRKTMKAKPINKRKTTAAERKHWFRLQIQNMNEDLNPPMATPMNQSYL